MNRLGGATLSARMSNGAMDQREAAAIMEKPARTLAHARGRGILHRDLKPDNVLFDDAGEPHLRCGTPVHRAGGKVSGEEDALVAPGEALFIIRQHAFAAASVVISVRPVAAEQPLLE